MTECFANMTTSPPKSKDAQKQNRGFAETSEKFPIFVCAGSPFVGHFSFCRKTSRSRLISVSRTVNKHCDARSPITTCWGGGGRVYGDGVS